MNRNRCLLIVPLIAAYANGVAASELDAGLRHDPFARPALAAPLANGGQPAPIGAKEWRPQLRAVIVAGKSSMVNVEGTIVSLGELIDGFRLTGVEDRKAVFMKDGVRVELTMGSDSAGGR